MSMRVTSAGEDHYDDESGRQLSKHYNHTKSDRVSFSRLEVAEQMVIYTTIKDRNHSV